MREPPASAPREKVKEPVVTFIFLFFFPPERKGKAWDEKESGPGEDS